MRTSPAKVEVERGMPGAECRLLHACGQVALGLLQLRVAPHALLQLQLLKLQIQLPMPHLTNGLIKLTPELRDALVLGRKLRLQLCQPCLQLLHLAVALQERLSQEAHVNGVAPSTTTTTSGWQHLADLREHARAVLLQQLLQGVHGHCLTRGCADGRRVFIGTLLCNPRGRATATATARWPSCWGNRCERRCSVAGAAPVGRRCCHHRACWNRPRGWCLLCWC
mmetsp:Transcript_32009/g.84472  ORF Transcript_32009/g.84472 Transcript_32009/m.84472 type:complete len:224 (-) Transcript_32009:296-967(-)